MLVFVDTNVLLYASDSSEPVKQPIAHAWLEHLWDQQAGRVSAQVLSEYHTTACRKLSKPLTPDEAWKEVETYFAWNPRPIDRDVLTQAREVQSRWKLNWWDCLIVAAARLQDCTLLLSEDLQDGMRFGDLTVRNPFELSVEDAMAAYRPGRASRRAVRRA